jgi:hypothetical protein
VRHLFMAAPDFAFTPLTEGLKAYYAALAA